MHCKEVPWEHRSGDGPYCYVGMGDYCACNCLECKVAEREALPEEHVAQIDWKTIGAAVAYYSGKGYKYVEVPWVVPEQTARITFPYGDVTYCNAPAGVLVGSAEQSFLELLIRDGTKRFESGLFVAATPCFRNEPKTSDLLHYYFFKVELFALGSEHVSDFIRDALGFFQSLPGGSAATIVTTPEGWDIMVNGIEVGSYGTRTVRRSDGQPLTWSYGTGFADPRFTTAAKHKP